MPLYQDMDHWRAVMNMVTNSSVSYTSGNFLNTWLTISVSRTTLFHSVSIIFIPDALKLLSSLSDTRTDWERTRPTLSRSPILATRRTLPPMRASSSLPADCSVLVVSSSPSGLVVRNRSVTSSVWVRNSSGIVINMCWDPLNVSVVESVTRRQLFILHVTRIKNKINNYVYDWI
jgi:hypothetical protein